jgi:hypothetical protein
MNSSPRLPTRLLLALLLAGPCTAALAADPDLDLLVEHDLTEIGADGVTRNVHFQERFHRRDGMIWIERVIPAGAHEAGAHSSADHEHKHMDLAAAARWITLEGGTLPRVRLVNGVDRVVVEVPAAEYGEIGFDGSWESAWHLLDPRQLQSMRPAPGQAPAGTRWYQAAAGQQTVRVLWDEKARIPRRIESSNAAGTSRKRMTASDVAAPRSAPWKTLAGYQQKEYSDYLD